MSVASAVGAAEAAELAAAYRFCRGVARREAKNFFYAFRVLPQAKSDAMCAVYAFMRKADDLADDESLTLDERREAMARWTEAWRCSRLLEETDPVFVAVRDAQRRFGIPDELLEQLIAGTTLDLQPRMLGVEVLRGEDGGEVQVYQTREALERYCYLVASVVGLVCIRVFGYSDPTAEELAIETGVAFQLTNILRDVREDAERGRLYLSADVLAEHGLRPEEMLQVARRGEPDARVMSAMGAFLREAQGLYRSAGRLVPLLEPDARPAMRVLAGIYHRLLDRIAERPEAVFRGRVSVAAGEKVAMLLEGGIEAGLGRASEVASGPRE